MQLFTYLAEQTGIELSGLQVRRILKQKKYSYKSATVHSRMMSLRYDH